MQPKGNGNFVDQFPQNIYIPKVNIIQTTTNDKNEIVIKCKVLQGMIRVGDYIKVPHNNRQIPVFVKNVYINDQQTALAVEGEICELITNKNTRTEPLLSLSEVICFGISSLLTEIVSVGIAESLFRSKKINENKYQFLLGCPLLREKIMFYPLNENLLDKLKDAGLKALKGNWKKIAVGTALGIFIYNTFNKLNKNCLTKIGKAKLECQKNVIEKIISDLRSQAAECNSILDPKQKRNCLRTVETKRRQWVEKLAKINEQINKYPSGK